MIINLSDMPEDKDFSDYPEGTLFSMKGSVARYILEPFEIIPPEDPRYKNALTREEVEGVDLNKNLNDMIDPDNFVVGNIDEQKSQPLNCNLQKVIEYMNSTGKSFDELTDEEIALNE